MSLGYFLGIHRYWRDSSFIPRFCKIFKFLVHLDRGRKWIYQVEFGSNSVNLHSDIRSKCNELCGWIILVKITKFSKTVCTIGISVKFWSMGLKILQNLGIKLASRHSISINFSNYEGHVCFKPSSKTSRDATVSSVCLRNASRKTFNHWSSMKWY